MWEHVLGPKRDAVLDGAVAGQLTGRLVAAEEVAAAVLALMANASMTGAIVHVDGGARLS